MFCLCIPIYKTEEEYVGKLFLYKINRSICYTQKLLVFFKKVNAWSLSHFNWSSSTWSHKVYLRVCQKSSKIQKGLVCLWMPKGSPECARMTENKNSIISRQEFAQRYAKQHWLWIESCLQKILQQIPAENPSQIIYKFWKALSKQTWKG